MRGRDPWAGRSPRFAAEGDFRSSPGWGQDPVVFGGSSADTQPMNGVAPIAPSARKVAEIKRLIELGQYQVDPHLVADAMILRAEREVDALNRRGPQSPAQNTCSYPASSKSASVKVTPGCPSTTVPTKVRELVAVGQAA